MGAGSELGAAAARRRQVRLRAVHVLINDTSCNTVLLNDDVVQFVTYAHAPPGS